MAIGATPRYLEELRIGGGYGDSVDGGAEIEKNGNISTDGDITLLGILSAGATPQPLTNAAGELDGARLQAGSVDSAQLASDLTLDGAVTAEDLNVTDDLEVDGDARVNGKLIVAPDTQLTIASGVITVTQVYHSIQGEGAANDDLVTINGGEEGQFLVFRSATSSHSITVKNGTGNIFCGGDFFMNNVADMMLLFKAGTSWFEVSRSNNG